MSDMPPPPQGPWRMERWNSGGGIPYCEPQLVTTYRIEGDVFMVRFEDGTLQFLHLTTTTVELTPTN